MTGTSKALAFEWAQGYRDGFERGYHSGIGDGTGLGFYDVKTRVYTAFKDNEDALRILEAVIGPPVFEDSE